MALKGCWCHFTHTRGREISDVACLGLLGTSRGCSRFPWSPGCAPHNTVPAEGTAFRVACSVRPLCCTQCNMLGSAGTCGCCEGHFIPTFAGEIVRVPHSFFPCCARCGGCSMCNVSAMQTPTCCTPGSRGTLRGDKCKCGLSRAAPISVLLLELRPQDESGLRALVKSIWLATSHPLPLTPSSLLMFSSARKSGLSCV